MAAPATERYPARSNVRRRELHPSRCFVLLAVLAALIVTPVAAAADWEAVGRVNVAGLRARSFCTGTLVAPDRVLTAAHCLFNDATGQRVALSNVHFVAGWDRGQFVAHGQPTSAQVAPGYVWRRSPTAATFRHDLAVLELAQPLDAPVIDTARVHRPDGPVTIVHYDRSRPHLAATSKACNVVDDVAGLWLLDCAVEAGASGGPVLVGGPGDARVVAIVVGSRPGSGTASTVALPLGAPTGAP